MSEVSLYALIGSLASKRQSGCHVRGKLARGSYPPHPTLPHLRRIRQARLQGYLAHKEMHPPQDPTVGICLRPYGGPRGEGQFFMSEVPL